MTQIFLKINGLKEFKSVLNKSPKIAGEQLVNALNSTADDIRRFARQYAPHRTGELSRSIGIKKATERNLIALVGTSLFYAPYQEFGTGIYVGKGYIYPKRAKLLRFRTRSGKWVFARRVKGTPPVKYMSRAGQDGKTAWAVYSDKALKNINYQLANLPN